MKKFLYWLPRVLSIAYIAFISLFALDVLGEPQWFLALLIHLIPTYILTFLTIIAWKQERWGGLFLIIAGLATLLFFRFQAMIISLPVLILGVLFLVSRRQPPKK